MRKIENLVFKGGGVLGIAYAGAIKALEDANMMDNIKRVAGTSAGSIAATLLSLNYTSSEIRQISTATNQKKFEDRWNPLRLLTKYGLYKGDYFLSWIKNLIKQKTNNENITYAELAEQGFRELKVFATNLNQYTVKEFSNEKTPQVIVAESVRASMSIPLFFSAWRFPKENPDKHIYVDGGLVYNYPITAFEDLNKTLGFFLYDDEKEESDLRYYRLSFFIKSLFKMLLKIQTIDFNKNSLENDITVKINDFGISPTNFDITKEMQDKLYNSGLEATQSYIQKM